MKNFIMDGAIISRIIACFFFVKKKFILVIQYSLCKQMLPLFFFFYECKQILPWNFVSVL